ncbi:MAG: hypothetical protein KC464_22035, partial [Myxococcales bacterium]|nr:hypothetical protein [Myxococcales bacterium]
AEAAIVGAPVGEATADAAAAALAAELTPITDVRSTAPYRLATVQQVVRRFVLEASSPSSPD